MTSIDRFLLGVLKTTGLDNVIRHVIHDVEFGRKSLLNLVSNSLQKLFSTGIRLAIVVVSSPGKNAEF